MYTWIEELEIQVVCSAHGDLVIQESRGRVVAHAGIGYVLIVDLNALNTGSVEVQPHYCLVALRHPRTQAGELHGEKLIGGERYRIHNMGLRQAISEHLERLVAGHRACRTDIASGTLHRSEEHTSELQSPCNLVCR